MNQEKIKFESDGIDVDAELFSPGVKGKQSLVVIAYGTAGMMEPFGAMYLRFAKGLAQAGFFALLPDYLARTKTPHDLEMLRLLPIYRSAWVSALGDAIDTAIKLDQINGGWIALCGFSLGGNLMLHVAQTHRANAFVDFFAPTVTIDPTSAVTEAMVSNLPPTLIHHGNKDEIVPLSDSKLLNKWLEKTKIGCKLIPYEQQGHPSLNNPSSWSIKSQDDSLLATTAFLRGLM